MKRIIITALVLAVLMTVLAILPGCGSAEEEMVELEFIQFYDPECPYCQEMEPIVANLRTEYESRIKNFEIIDITTDAGKAKAEEFGVFLTPTFFLLDSNGDTLDKISGATTEANMIKFIDRGIADVKGESTGTKDTIPTEGGTQQDFDSEQ